MSGQPGAGAQEEHRATIAEDSPEGLASRYADYFCRDSSRPQGAQRASRAIGVTWLCEINKCPYQPMRKLWHF
jgi:hypothetical protein